MPRPGDLVRVRAEAADTGGSRTVVRPRVYREMTSARVVGIPNAQLDVHPTALRQDQRSPHLQLLDRSASGYRGGVQGEFDESGARQQCGAQNRVVGHPRVRRE